MAKQNERRKHKRHKVQCAVYYNEYQPRLNRDKMFKADLINLSEEGALIEGPQALEVKDLVTIEMNLIGWKYFYARKYEGLSGISESDSLWVSSTILHIKKTANNKYQLGVHFTHLKAQDREVLREYIAKRVLFEL